MQQVGSNPPVQCDVLVLLMPAFRLLLRKAALVCADARCCQNVLLCSV